MSPTCAHGVGYIFSCSIEEMSAQCYRWQKEHLKEVHLLVFVHQ